MKFLNTVICYNNSDEVIRYIRSLHSKKADNLFFSVVINAGDDKDRAALKDMVCKVGSGFVSIYDPRTNLGYLNGLLYGYRQYIQEHEKVDYVIFSNTDIEINDSNFFEKFELRKYSSDIGCIGPSIYVKERKVYDNPVCDEKRPLSEINKLLKLLAIPFIRGIYVFLSDYKGRIKRRNKTSSRYVYEVHGCFFILSNSFAHLLSQKDYRALMYSEEAYIAENIRKNGYKTYYDSDIEVVHLEHSVTKSLKCEKIAKHIYESMKIIREDFYTNE